MKVANNSKAVQGLNTKAGRVFLRPEETKDVELDAAAEKQARRLPFLKIDGKAAAPADDKK